MCVCCVFPPAPNIVLCTRSRARLCLGRDALQSVISMERRRAHKLTQPIQAKPARRLNKRRRLRPTANTERMRMPPGAEREMVRAIVLVHTLTKHVIFGVNEAFMRSTRESPQSALLLLVPLLSRFAVSPHSGSKFRHKHTAAAAVACNRSHRLIQTNQQHSRQEMSCSQLLQNAKAGARAWAL